MITDVHSHILPQIDDGSDSTETTLKLFEMMQKQGIENVIATPHFYASDTSMESFITGREEALKKTLEAAKKENKKIPDIKLGAEVYYFKGIGKSEPIKQLVLGDSNYFLLELQNAPITDKVMADILGLHEDLKLIPIFAHIERFIYERGFKKIEELLDDGICLAQMNADSLLEFPTKRKAFKLIEKGYISFLGTDTHSLKSRPPKMDQALTAIEQRLGKETKEHFINNGNRLFSEI